MSVNFTVSEVSDFISRTGLNVGNTIELEYWKGDVLFTYSGAILKIKFANEMKSKNSNGSHFLLFLNTDNGIRSFWSNNIKCWAKIK